MTVFCLFLPSRATGEINFWELGKNNARCVRTANLRTQRRWKKKKKPRHLFFFFSLNNQQTALMQKQRLDLHYALQVTQFSSFFLYFFFLSQIGMER